MLSDIVRTLIFLVALAQGASLPGEATEELLGELPEGSRVNQVTMAVSAAGYHVAWVGKQGLAPSVFVNGRPVPGPTVEDIGDIALNSLGDHVAWTAKRGKSWFAILDGQPVGSEFSSVEHLAFAPDGRLHVRRQTHRQDIRSDR